MELPDLGLVVIQDSETGEQVLVDTHDAKFRARFADAAARREAELRAALRQAQVDTLELCTDDDLADAIFRFADLRKRRSQLANNGGLPGHLSPVTPEVAQPQATMPRRRGRAARAAAS
jgi:hypothetical protein